MKKNRVSPIFEIAFAAGIMIILSLPLFVKAQDHKEFRVNISNSDTIVNGKNIKELSANERKDALKKINELNDHITFTAKSGGDDLILFKDRQKDGKNKVYIYRDGVKGDMPAIAYNLSVDSADRGMVIADNMEKLANVKTRAYSLRTAGGFGDEIRLNDKIYTFGSRKNTQSFSYSNTDSEGINTHINFNVSDANAEKLKKISGTEKADLNIHDLSIVPSFTTGKTTLSFSLPGKGAEVQLKDSEGTVIWSDKTAGNEFSKSFVLPKNGVYYLQVKQAGKLALRRITKEE